MYSKETHVIHPKIREHFCLIKWCIVWDRRRDEPGAEKQLGRSSDCQVYLQLKNIILLLKLPHLLDGYFCKKQGLQPISGRCCLLPE
jgi:hypothetical protein